MQSKGHIKIFVNNPPCRDYLYQQPTKAGEGGVIKCG